ncbi:hypothetical protein KOW79_020577 [Hemibagrus wyckioides]|uniref:Trichohyalin-plectin-homology domain-containing protein n=1 Tax=Hemibagrus wyckioides TaxID=337641 RepID=A0A9D3S8Y2_9TELE|nr:cilia- and flagella- associated protein 210-like [Hemibagrus wyckioides]KAG7315711.1 hypothetical protein KOW79_020577 [Hemibagrus wyckioides]
MSEEKKNTEASVPVGQFVRRKGTIRKGVLPEVIKTLKLPVDLHEATVFSTSDWKRIQDSANCVNEQQDRLDAAVREREALHLRSKEVVKNWPNTLAAQRQKRLELKRIKKEIEEEKLKQLDLEEAKFQAMKRKEAIERAKTLQFLQTDRVKRFHSAVLMTEVLKEREAQIELKKRKEIEAKKEEERISAMIARNTELALQEQREKAEERKQKRLAHAEFLKQQVKEHEQAREKEMMEKKKEEEELRHFQELYEMEQTMLKQKKQEEKRKCKKAYEEELANKKIFQASEAKKQEMEEEKRKLVVEAKDKQMKLRKEKEAEMFREFQRPREIVADRLAEFLAAQSDDEDEVISRAAAEAVAKKDKEQREKEKKEAAVLRSIAEHREAVHKELKRKKQKEKQEAAETLKANKAADLLYHQTQKIKAQKKKEAAKLLQDSYVHQMNEKHAKKQLREKQKQECKVRNAQLIAEEEKQFQTYAKDVIETARKGQRNTSILHKASKVGIGGGRGPVFDGIRPSYQVQDESGAELPSYVPRKKLDVTTYMQESRKRLGFTR